MPPVQQPQQFPAPAPAPPEPSPYDFFMEPQKPQKQGLFSGGAGGQKIILIACVVIIGLVLAGIAAFIASSSKTDPTSLVTIAQTQQEVIRVATDGSKNAKTLRLQNFAVTTAVTVTSSQRELVGFLEKRGTKVKDSSLNVSKNTQTDTALAAAVASNTYDVTFESSMKTELDNYEGQLNEANALATTKAERDLLQKQTISAQLLRKQLLGQ